MHQHSQSSEELTGGLVVQPMRCESLVARKLLNVVSLTRGQRSGAAAVTGLSKSSQETLFERVVNFELALSG